MSTIIAEPNVYAAQFVSERKRLAGSHLPWLERLREKGMDDFVALGFPTTKLENWKYTNVAPIRRIAFQPSVDGAASLPVELNFGESPRVVFVNGRFSAELSTVRTLSISEGLRIPERASAIQTHLGGYTTTSNHAFAAWNTAFFTDGAYLNIPRGMICEQPIHLVFLSDGNGEPCVSHPRNLIVAGESSQVTFVEWFIGRNDGVYLTNTVTEIVAGPAAMIDYYKIERESPRAFHVSVTNAHLERDAGLTSHSISLGGSLVRNDMNVELDGEGSHCTLNGLFAVDGQRLVDNHTRIDHVRPHASSRELYKGVLAGNAEGVFNGTIVVHANAQKTDAVQHSKNLLLSRQAQINTKPQLEIHNNDVRCFHGATIGQIDDDAVFYLKSRGIAEDEAKRILVRAFAGEVVAAIRIPIVRDQLEHLMDAWLRGVLEAS